MTKERVSRIGTLAAILLVVIAVFAGCAYLGDRPTLMYFRSATWPFCKEFNPIVDEVKGSYGGRINFVYIEIGSPDGKESAKEHGVMGTPTILLFDREGNHFYTIQGVQPRPVLEKVLDKLLAEDWVK